MLPMSRPVLTLCAAWLACALTVSAHLTVQPQPAFDVLIVNGRVLDGSGNPWTRVDVGIRGDRIAAVGRLAGQPATLVVDAAGRTVAPGFIDVHSHALGGLSRDSLRDARALLAQGLTTVVGNPDGGGPTDLAAQAGELETGGIGVNAALLIGHASVRRAAMRTADGQTAQGTDNRDPTPDELDAMKAIVRQAMADGAFGLSSGLFYVPGRYAKTEEVIALAREAGHVYTSHIRDEGNYDAGVVASVNEVIRIAEEAGVRGVVSHMKALGPDSWGQTTTLVANIEAARARGVEVYADQYPYEASSTSLGAALTLGQGNAALAEAMAGEESRRLFLEQVRENIRRRGGAASIVMASGRGVRGLEGQNLEQIAASRGVAPEQAAADLLVAGGASIVSFNMADEDIDRLMRQTWTMASSDGGLTEPGAGQPHPRGNGAFARRLARYVRERGVISIEHAIRTATSLPARVFAIEDRGEIRPGAFADVVIFDLANVQDRATYTDPHQLAAGFDWVLVNGQVAIREGEFTGVRAGVVLRRAQ
jgi:N-acyl-D-aspartate/D-glutamate deacylase